MAFQFYKRIRLIPGLRVNLPERRAFRSAIAELG